MEAVGCGGGAHDSARPVGQAAGEVAFKARGNVRKCFSARRPLNFAQRCLSGLRFPEVSGHSDPS